MLYALVYGIKGRSVTGKMCTPCEKKNINSPRRNCVCYDFHCFGNCKFNSDK